MPSTRVVAKLFVMLCDLFIFIYIYLLLEKPVIHFMFPPLKSSRK